MLTYGAAFSQLNVSNTYTPQQLVQNILVGGGAAVSNISFSGSPLEIGDFSNGSSTNIGLNSGILLCTGNIINAIGPNNATGKGTNVGGGSNALLANLIPGYSIYDAAVLEFDFVPLSDTIKFEYVFASEEYPEYVNSNFNDVFGFFISGVNPSGGNYVNKNIAIIPGTSLPVSIDNVNNGTTNSGPCTNCSYYVNNTNGTTIQYDAFTTVLTSWALVTPCLTYHIKIAIGDAGDHIYDSGVFLKAGSFRSGEDVVQTNTLIGASAPNAVEGCNDAIVNFTLPNPTGVARTVHYVIAGTATNGVDYPTIADSVVFAAGTDSVSVTISPINDNIVEGSETVVLLVETSICTYDTVIVSIYDYDTVQVNIPAVVGACPSATSNLQANASLGFPPYQYLWSTLATTQSIQVNPTNTTSYQVVVNDGCGFSDSSLVSVNVFTPPNVVINPDSQWICPNGSASMTASGANTYSWSPSSTLSSNTGATVIASPNTNTTYTVIGTDTNSCSDTTSANIYIYPTPVINPINGAICPGDSILLTANTNVVGSSFNWNTGDTTQAIYVKPLATSTYTVTITYPNSCTQIAQSTVQVYSLSTISISLSSPSVCPGDSVFVQATTANNYSWLINGQSTSISGSSFWTIPTSTSQINVTATDANSCPVADSTTLNVFTPPQVQVSASSNSVCLGNITQLTASGASSYLWSPAASLSSNTGSTVFAIPTATTLYNVIGTDANQCKDTAQIQITLNSLPVVIASADTGICPNTSAQLQVSGAQFYSWTPSTGLNSTTGNLVTANPNTTSSYIVTGTDANGCQNKDTINVTVYPQVSINAIAAPDSICVGDSTSLSASGAATYLWSPAIGLNSTSGANIIASPSSNQNYQVIGSDIHGCSDTSNLQITVISLPNVNITTSPTICAGDTCTLNAIGAVSYNWTPNNGSPLTGASITVSPQTTQTYLVVGANGFGCTDSATTNVNVNPLPSLSINAPSAICNGDSAQLTASGASTYQWLPTGFGNSIIVFPTTNSTYTVIGTDTNGCIDSISQNITVNPLPILNINPSSTTACSGNSVSLTASANMPITNYSWSTGASSSTISINPTSTALYSVSGTNNYGCIDSTNISITVYALPQVQIATSNSAICFGDTTYLSATGANTYSWSPNTNLTSSTGSSVGAFPTSSTTITVIGIDSNNCADTAQAIITVNQLPVLSINSPSAICNGDTAQLIASGATTYQWLPSGFGNTINVSPNSNSSYTVIGTDANGCTDSISKSIIVNPLPVLNITPSANSICAGNSVNLNASANMPLNGFFWNNGMSGNSIWVNPTTTTSYSVSGTNSYGCIDSAIVTITAYALPQVQITPANSPICIGDTALLTANGAATYSWSPTTNLSANTGSSVNAFPTSSTTITVIGTDTNNCVDTAQTYITVNSLPILSISAPSAICNGDSAVLTASGANVYQWLPNGFGNSITVSPNTTSSYTVIGTDSNGCVDSISQSLTVNPLPILNITPSSNATCAGSSVNLLASTNMPINSFSWNTGASGNSIWVNPLASTTYTVSGTNSFGCTDSAQTNILVYALPQVQISTTNSAICIGDTTSLTANGAITYTWAPSNSLTATSGNTVGAFPTTSSTITVIGTDTNNCVDTAVTYITVNPLPTLSINAPNAICIGDSAQLIASGANTYQWLPSGTGNSIFVSPNSTSTYTLIGTDVNGCVDSISQNITVNPLPILSIAASQTTTCAGDTIQLNASANMNITNYAWSNGLSGNSIIVNPMATTNYGLVGTNSFGCSDSVNININVHQYPLISLSLVDTNICFGDSIIINSTTSIGGLTYSWTNGSSTPFIKISPNQTTTYTLSVVDSIGCADSSSALVKVVPLPIVNATASSYHICAHDTINVSVNAQANTSNLNWSNGLVTSNFSAILTNDTSFVITVSDSLGCQNKDSISIIVNPIPQLTLTPANPSICIGDTTTLIVSSSVNPVNFLWSNNSTNSSIIVHPNATTVYHITASDSIGCSATTDDTVVVNNLPLVVVNPPFPSICQGASITLTASTTSNGVTYIWNNGSPGASITVSPLNTSIFNVMIIDTNGCKNRAGTEVKVNPNPSVVVNPKNKAICNGDSILLSANVGSLSNLTYLWNTGDTIPSFYITPTSNGTYSVQVTDTNGCQATDNMTVTVTMVPVCNILAQSPICTADSSIISVSGTFSNGSVVNWNFDGGQIVAGTGTGPLGVKWNNAGIYTVTLSMSYKNCTSEPDTQVVQVFQTPTVNFTSMTKEACGAGDIQFVNNTPGMKSYFWRFNDYYSNFDTSSKEHPIYHYSKPGAYYVSLEVTSHDGCTAHLVIPNMINVYPLPVANFTMSKEKVDYTDPLVNFYDQSKDAVSWDWDFDDLKSGIYNTSTDQDPFHVFQDTGEYYVTLIVNSDHNCKDTISKKIINTEVPTFYIPNAFTPNNDGLNDTFFPKGNGYDWDTYEMYIYDRWGELVYKTHDINEGWNGTKGNTGEVATDDVYSYIIFIDSPEGVRKKFVGKVILFH
jgi:gliding motility-associated-like protein